MKTIFVYTIAVFLAFNCFVSAEFGKQHDNNRVGVFGLLKKYLRQRRSISEQQVVVLNGEPELSMISYKQGDEYIYEYVPASSIYAYTMNRMYHYIQEDQESFASVIHVESDHGRYASNLIMYGESVIYTDVNSFTVPDVSTLTSENPYIIEFPDVMTIS